MRVSTNSCAEPFFQSVDLMAIGAANAVGSVRAGHPIADFLVLGMAAQAGSVGLSRGTISVADNFRDVSAGLDMQAAGAVAVFALDPLLGVKGMAKIAAHVRVARFARLRAHSRGAGNRYVFSETGDLPTVRFLLCQ